MASTSTGTGWSCATLQDGLAMMDLDVEAQALLKEMEEPFYSHSCSVLLFNHCFDVPYSGCTPAGIGW